mmetsp:Transcript_14609/g.47951  ORF Transcript_14609/g.47951 Transcript_14609/m.47951 type:complete len:298 (-) Transcript_14609:344-1237(-)
MNAESSANWQKDRRLRLQLPTSATRESSARVAMSALACTIEGWSRAVSRGSSPESASACSSRRRRVLVLLDPYTFGCSGSVSETLTPLLRASSMSSAPLASTYAIATSRCLTSGSSMSAVSAGLRPKLPGSGRPVASANAGAATGWLAQKDTAGRGSAARHSVYAPPQHACVPGASASASRKPPTAASPDNTTTKSRQCANRSPIFTPPKIAVDVRCARSKMTYFACVGMRCGVKETFLCLSASALSSLASDFVRSIQRVNSETPPQSHDKLSSTPRPAAASSAASTARVEFPGSIT